MAVHVWDLRGGYEDLLVELDQARVAKRGLFNNIFFVTRLYSKRILMIVR